MCVLCVRLLETRARTRSRTSRPGCVHLETGARLRACLRCTYLPHLRPAYLAPYGCRPTRASTSRCSLTLNSLRHAPSNKSCQWLLFITTPKYYYITFRRSGDSSSSSSTVQTRWRAALSTALATASAPGPRAPAQVGACRSAGLRRALGAHPSRPRPSPQTSLELRQPQLHEQQ